MRLWYRFVKFAFRRLYNEFAWTYDLVSRVVSRGRWRSWQRAALPQIDGQKVLEVAFGTGNLLWDMVAQGYHCVGIDLSPHMVRIAARKFRRRGRQPPICRARAQQLPFGDRTFDSLVLTFPDYFIFDPVAQAEMARVLVRGGRLIHVDGAHIVARDPWSRFLDWAFRITVSPRSRRGHRRYLDPTVFTVKRREMLDVWSTVAITVAVKKSEELSSAVAQSPSPTTERVAS
jgi:ubiquinone/menaquinone biosynthesis C-methylase UbiE